MKTTYQKRKEIFKELLKQTYSEDHLKKIDVLARELGILIPHSYLCTFTAENQDKVLNLLLEAERNHLLSKSWIFSIIRPRRLINQCWRCLVSCLL